MFQYVFRRLLLFPVTMFFVSLIIFSLVQLAPGDAADIMAEESSAEVREAIRERLGLNDPVLVQYMRWLTDLLRGELGHSIFTGRSVTEDIWYRIPTSLQLGGMALIMTGVLGVTVGIVSALKPEGWADQVLRGGTVLSISVPIFWTATLLLVIPSALLGYHPPPYYVRPTESLAQNMQILVPLAFILSLNGVGRLGRLMRTTMLDVLHQDYIRTARAKGLSERVVTMRHATRNAMIPVVTLLGLEVPSIFAGALLVEVIWGIPGMGSFLFGSIQRRDIMVVMNLNMFIALIVLTSNLIVDLTYGVLDPRIRLT